MATLLHTLSCFLLLSLSFSLTLSHTQTLQELNQTLEKCEEETLEGVILAWPRLYNRLAVVRPVVLPKPTCFLFFHSVDAHARTHTHTHTHTYIHTCMHARALMFHALTLFPPPIIARTQTAEFAN